MNLIKNVTFGLIGSTFGVTSLGVIYGGELLAIVSVVLGGGAMVAALIDKNHLQKKKLNTQLTIEI
jgi:hypothetical protein